MSGILPTDRDGLVARWKSNEDELNRIHAMTGLDREMHAEREDELLGEQDAIEHLLGLPLPLFVLRSDWLGRRFRRRSGMP